MLAYHAAWDLHAFGLLALDPGAALPWRILGHGVAGAFLLVSGISLGVARLRGVTMGRMASRLARVGVCALLVTGATLVLSPSAPVWFGILHCIAVTSLCALMAIRMRTPVLLGLAGVATLAPLLVRLPLGTGWAWTGLTANLPASLDFRPTLPWLGVVLAGLAVGRSRWPWRLAAVLARVPDRPAWVGGALRWSGRHSLGLYLVHQPVLVGALMLGLGTGWPSTPVDPLRDPADAAAFLQQCRRQCGLTGGDAALCLSTCHCVLTRALTAAQTTRIMLDASKIGAAVAACRPVEPDAAPRLRQ